jgi:hypothetical protein
MIGLIGTSVTISLNYNEYSAIANLNTFQPTVAHTLGFSVSTSRLLATDLNTETSTSNHYEVFLPILFQSPWTFGTATSATVKVKVTLRLTVSQSVILGVEPQSGSLPDIYYSLTVTVLYFWGDLSDEKTRLSFVYAAGPRQPSLSRVIVLWDSWHFTVSDLRLPFSSPPTTRRVTVELFEPASTHILLLLSESESHCDWRSVSLSVSTSKSKLCYDRRPTHLELMTKSLLLPDSCRFVDVGRSLWREDGSIVCQTQQ